MSLWIFLILSNYLSAAAKRMPAKIKRIFANREVYENEGIHIQCVVDYHEPRLFDEIIVEVHRSLFNSTGKLVFDCEQLQSKKCFSCYCFCSWGDFP